MNEEVNPADHGSADEPSGQRVGAVEPESSEQVRSDQRAGIDEAVAALDVLGELPLSAHVDRFEAVHTELTTALSSIDRV